jgi:hypothetical protein
MSIYDIPRLKTVGNVQKFYALLTLMNREDELRRLTKWADRNGRVHPLHLYKNRLADTEKALSRARIDAPYVTRYAHAAFILKRVLFPQSKYYRKGSASAYKRILLTP